MKFKADPKHRGWLLRGTSAVAAALLLASCGGGTQVDHFTPGRLLAFGDESSVITSTGAKYSINGYNVDANNAPTTINCNVNPIWIQFVSGIYNLVFAGCNTDGATPTARTLAQPNATVGDVTDQITQFSSGDSISGRDMVTLQAGANDIVGLYKQFPGLDANALQSAAWNAGNALGAQVIRLTDLGAKVIVATAPDMGLSPFAAKEEAANPGRAAFLTALSFQFNAALRLKLEEVKNGGKSVGLVVFDERLQDMARNYPNYGLVSTNVAACTDAAVLPNCSTTTLKKVPDSGSVDATSSNFLWADDLHFGPTAHYQLGSMAASRANNNPF